MSRATKVLLIYPTPSVSSPQKSPPLSILHVGRALTEAKARGKSDQDYEVRYFDERYDSAPDMTWPDVVGVSSMTGHQLKGTIRWLKEAKRNGKRTVLGGIHVTTQPEQCLAEDYVDSVVLSEGEWGILPAIHGGHKERVHGHLLGTADHVSPVGPDTLVHFQRSARTGDSVLMTSRGCPFRCGFCLDGDTQVMLPDLSWLPIRDIQAGGEVFGLSKEYYGQHTTVAKVLATSRRRAETFEIMTDRGAVIATREHPWLLYASHTRWRNTGELVPGDKIRWLSQPVDAQLMADQARVFGIGLGHDYALVLSVTPAGEREVYDIQTTTENFIANGLVSHNCYIQIFFERSWQPVDMDRWRHDVLYLKENAGVVKYEHGDDWIGKWPRARQVIKFLWDNDIEYRPSIRAHQINDEVAREMAEMGIEHISVGMETGSDRMLKLTEKDITKQDQVTCAEALAKHGIQPLFYWILGFPTETHAEVSETLDQVDLMAKIFKSHRTPLTQNCYAYVALPGSPMYDLVDKDSLPQSMEAWSNYTLNKTYNQEASNLYHIGGLTFHRSRGDKTDRNFPGWRRLLIAPFELLAVWRWRKRYFKHFQIENWFIEQLLKWASRRYELATTGKKVKDADMIDWGVRENQPDIGARGEYATGEMGKKQP